VQWQNNFSNDVLRKNSNGAGPKVKGQVIRYEFLSDSRQYTLITLFHMFCASLLFEQHNYFSLSLRLARGCAFCAQRTYSKVFLISMAFLFQNTGQTPGS